MLFGPFISVPAAQYTEQLLRQFETLPLLLSKKEKKKGGKSELEKDVRVRACVLYTAAAEKEVQIPNSKASKGI